MAERPSALPVDPAEVAVRLAAVRERIVRAGGDPDAIEIVAVTKGFGAWAIEAAAAAGATVVGESYAQELLTKVGDVVPGVLDSVDLHFIGAMQTNKVRKIAHLVDVWQSVDRASLVHEIAKRSPGASVMLQLDIAGVVGQGGCPLAEAPVLLETARAAGLAVVGCMAIGPQGDVDMVRTAFEQVTAFADAHGLEQRSMGMTGDLEAAVAAGTTMIRVGTALFGERPQR
jgi:uncharacterized pyridoxal phosphate-containing UPF0001 family protein